VISSGPHRKSVPRARGRVRRCPGRDGVIEISLVPKPGTERFLSRRRPRKDNPKRMPARAIIFPHNDEPRHGGLSQGFPGLRGRFFPISTRLLSAFRPRARLPARLQEPFKMFISRSGVFYQTDPVLLLPTRGCGVCSLPEHGRGREPTRREAAGEGASPCPEEPGCRFAVAQRIPSPSPTSPEAGRGKTPTSQSP